MFSGFSDATQQFFLDIRFHNSTTYFHEHHDRYIRDVQTPFYEFFQGLIPVLTEIDPEMEQRPHRALARLHRDTRFSKDKSPYRDHLWLWCHRAGEAREDSVGFWFELGPQQLSWGLGSWGENRLLMERFRRELTAHPRRIGGIITSCGLSERHLALNGRQWKRLEIPPSIPQWLRPWYLTREFALMQMYPDFEEVRHATLLSHVSTDFRAMGPIYRMLRGMQDDIIEEAPQAGQ